ncbi:MAG: hypothetical protein ABL921_11520 [Pirellula sp.]
MIRFIWKRQGSYIAIYVTVLVVVGIVIACFGWNAVAVAGDWWGKCSALLGVAAIGVATLVWIGEINEDWEESLPKTLTAVFFMYGPEESRTPIMACINASLTGESDIRAMGQQIGLQLNEKKPLDMTPSIKVLEPYVDKESGIKRYMAYFYLDQVPQAVQKLQLSSPSHGLIRTEADSWQIKPVSNLREQLEPHIAAHQPTKTKQRVNHGKVVSR